MSPYQDSALEERIATAKTPGASNSTVSALPVESIVKIAIAMGAAITWKMNLLEKKLLVQF
jgi:hypothetical protein